MLSHVAPKKKRKNEIFWLDGQILPYSFFFFITHFIIHCMMLPFFFKKPVLKIFIRSIFLIEYKYLKEEVMIDRKKIMTFSKLVWYYCDLFRAANFIGFSKNCF